MPQCKARVTYESEKLYFGDKKHYFYPEYQCQNSVDDGNPLCKLCRKKSTTTKTQEARCFDHGFIDGPFTEKSHIYGSPWYKKNVERYGEPKDAIDLVLRDNKEDMNSTDPPKKRRIIKKKIIRLGLATPQIVNTIDYKDVVAWEVNEDPLPVTNVEFVRKICQENNSE